MNVVGLLPADPDASARHLRDALSAGVSFAARGNLILLAPPLIISEQDLGTALDLLERLLGALSASLRTEVLA